EFPRFPREESEIPVCLCGEVIKTSLRRFGGWKKIFEATLQESQANALSEPLVCRWFNLHYVQKMIATGQRIVVFGKPRLRGKRMCMDHPEFEVIENDEEISIHFRRITPIYPATEGLSQRALRSILYRVLQAVAAMLLAAEAGYQTAFMAPTQILAEQHYDVLRRWLEPLGVRIALRTAARQEETGPLPLFASDTPPGSARVSRAGDGVAPSRTLVDRQCEPGAQYSRRRLPHFERPWAIYAVTIATNKDRCLSPNARTIVLESLRHFHNKRY